MSDVREGHAGGSSFPPEPARRPGFGRRPANAVKRLAGRDLLVLSARDLLRAAEEEGVLLVALVAPARAAIAGFVRAARDARAPLLLSRPSGAADERGPEEARDDAAFVEAALAEAEALRFDGPMALLKEPPRAGSAVPDLERVQREMEAGFTGLAVTARVDLAAGARDAALAAAEVCQRELGLELVPLGGSARVAAEVALQLAARGAPPSAVRLTGQEHEARAVARELGQVHVTSADEAAPARCLELGVQMVVAAGPFLRALWRSAPRELLDQIQAWADERGATLEQAAARHQRLLRELPAPAQERLEALCSFEAEELLASAGAQGTAERLALRVETY